MDNLTLMCFKGIEIQKLCQYKIGDRVYYWDGGHFSNEFILDEIAIYEHKDLHKETLANTKLWLAGKEWDELTGIYIWKPYQEQLQEIMLDPPNTLCPDILTLLRLLNIFASVNLNFTSINELSLAFVIHEKWNKSWNKEKKEWETIK